MRKNTRSFFSAYNIGDEVFYKRNDSPEWNGPGKVLGQKGSVLFIRQGSRYIKVHLCRVQPVHIQNIESSYSDNTLNTDTNANKQQNGNKNEFETEEEPSQNDADEQTSSIQQDSEQSNSNQQVNLSTLK